MQIRERKMTRKELLNLLNQLDCICSYYNESPGWIKAVDVTTGHELFYTTEEAVDRLDFLKLLRGR